MSKQLIRHGELVLVPIQNIGETRMFIDQWDALSEGEENVKTNYVVSHSETGHHHILEGDVAVLEPTGGIKDTFVNVLEDTNLVHVKDTEKHKTLPVKKGIYRVLKKKEYLPSEGRSREVWD